MADTKITGLTLGTPVSGDVTPYVSDPTGTPVTKKALMPISGTYTPTLGNVTNVAASTLNQDFQYIRVGSIVQVSGSIAVDPTSAATQTVLSITLPIASNFATIHDGNGIAACAASGEPAAALIANIAGDIMYMQYYPVSNANQGWRVSFMYKII